MNHTVIVGAGRSGLAAARYLTACGSHCVLTDSNPSPADGLLKKLAAWGVPGVWGGHPFSLLDRASEVVLSPVVNLTAPFVQAALEMGIPVIGELELAHRELRKKDPSAIVLAVTGTNGKSTTTDLTAHLLRASGLPAIACGNLGLPFLDAVAGAEPATRFVVECSSYQLETVVGFRAQAAAILNLTPDHLARHGTMEAYLAAKLRVFERQCPSDLCITPAEAPFLSGFLPAGRWATFGWGALGSGGLPGCIQSRCDEGGHLHLRDAEGGTAPILHSGELKIPGRHNVENALAAMLLAKHGGAATGSLLGGLRSYPGLAHRLAFVGEKSGVRAYNDSKATNVEAALTAVSALPGPMVLLLGCEDKGSSYTPLSAALEGKLRCLVFLGDAIPMLQRDLGGLPHSVHREFDEAVKHALALAQPGDQVLLSPACASFDQFANFEERGARFECLVADWLKAGG